MIWVGLALCVVITLVGLVYAYRLEMERASAKAKQVDSLASLNAFDVRQAAVIEHESYVEGIIERHIANS